MKALYCAAALLSIPCAAQAQKPATDAPVESVESNGAEEGKAGAAEPEMDPKVKALVAKVSAFKYETGEVKLQAGRAKLTLPEGYSFLGPKDGKVVIEELWGNPPGSASDIEGIVIPRGQDVPTSIPGPSSSSLRTMVMSPTRTLTISITMIS